jgi:hypothetical protein
MRTIVLCMTAISFSALAADQPQNDAPPVIRVYVERIKPGRSGAHEVSESAFVRAFAKANYPAHYLALSSMAGPEEVWFVEEHASFADVEKAEKAAEAPALRAELRAASAADGETLSNTNSLIAIYRKDLSYRAEEAVAELGKMRYVNVISARMKPGMDQKLASTVAEMQKIYNNAQMTQAVIVYQVISGAPAGMLLLFEPVTTLAEWDKYPAMLQALKTAGGRKFEALHRDLEDLTASEEARLMSISPRMSYVPKEIAAADPGFWMPKETAAKPAPKRPAVKRPAR